MHIIAVGITSCPSSGERPYAGKTYICRALRTRNPWVCRSSRHYQKDCLINYVMVYSLLAAQVVNQSRHPSWSGNSTDVLLVLLRHIPLRFPLLALHRQMNVVSFTPSHALVVPHTATRFSDIERITENDPEDSLSKISEIELF